MCRLVDEYAEKYAEKREAKGRTEGLIEGRMEGKLTGRVEGKVETIRNMLSKGITLEEALELTELDRKTYEEFSEVN